MTRTLRTLAVVTWAAFAGLTAGHAAAAGTAAVHVVPAAAPSTSAAAPRALKPLHPPFALLDAQGLNVLASGRGVSATKSCGQCHDSDYIASHAFHADLGLGAYTPTKTGWNASPGLFGQWDPLRYRYLSQAGDERLDLSTPAWLMINGERVVGGGPGTTSRSGKPLLALKPDANDPEASVGHADGTRSPWNWNASGTLEMDCFLCHIERPQLAARKAAIRDGRFADAATATLTGTPLVEAGAKGWNWNRAAFTADGRVDSRTLAIQDPTNANCAACHGQVHTGGAEPLQLSACDLDAPQTATTGQVVAAQRINASGVNLAGKAALKRSWDVHAERQLQCTDCHHALNNPAHVNDAKGRRPAHLRYDPRTLDIHQYLQRPDHQLARGQSAQVQTSPETKGTMRRCENCHDATTSHRAWLPDVQTHMARLACESCHIPKMFAPAIQTYDWTVLKPDGQPVQSCRGVNGTPGDVRALVTGFDPVLLQRRPVDGGHLLAPYNLITSFFWVYEDSQGNQRPVRRADLEAAFLKAGTHAPEIVAAFDTDGDGKVGTAELRIDSPQKEAAVKARLAQLGLQKVHMQGQVQPFSINHNVTRGEFALNDCQACHSDASRVNQGMQLAAFAPVLPAFDRNSNVAASGDIVRQDDGALFYRPAPARDGLYVFGANRLGWLDTIGATACCASWPGAGARTAWGRPHACTCTTATGASGTGCRPSASWRCCSPGWSSTGRTSSPRSPSRRWSRCTTCWRPSWWSTRRCRCSTTWPRRACRSTSRGPMASSTIPSGRRSTTSRASSRANRIPSRSGRTTA
jgi:hypothetical protein